MKNKIVFLDAGTMGDDITWPEFSQYGKVMRYEQTDATETAERINDANMVITNKVVLDKTHIEGAPHLRYIGTLATGYNQVDIKTAAARGIPVCNVPDYSTPAVVQHVFALILELYNQVKLHSQAVKNGEWAKCAYFSFWKGTIHELQGKTLGIVGYGHIGRKVAAVGHAFGMRIIAYAPRPKDPSDYPGFAFKSLEELFSESDIISLHCPLTSENNGFVNATLLQRMKKNALLINTARGPLINETDLAAALKNKVLTGAGLDVVVQEPILPDNPLLGLENCLITPHLAWASHEARLRLLKGVRDNIDNFLSGTPTNVVNLK